MAESMLNHSVLEQTIKALNSILICKIFFYYLSSDLSRIEKLSGFKWIDFYLSNIRPANRQFWFFYLIVIKSYT